MLTDEELEKYHQKLLLLREQLTAFDAVSRETSKTVDLDEPFGRLSRMDAIQQQKMSEAHKQRNEIRLRQVHAALDRMEHGEYGECMKCGHFIPKERLEARPEVPICIACQNEIESSR